MYERTDIHLFVDPGSTCEWKNSFFSSKQCSRVNNNKKGHQIFEVNACAIISFREIGRGYNAMENFARCMNIYTLAKTPFKNLNAAIAESYQSAARKSMKCAADELQGDQDGPAKTCVKIDGAWQKRGHSSLNGYVNAVVGDKCVDVEAFSKFCIGCRMWETKKDSPRYDSWKAQHICNINHVKSSGAMEEAGAVAMFHRSVEKKPL